jgi:hypothetical protein
MIFVIFADWRGTQKCRTSKLPKLAISHIQNYGNKKDVGVSSLVLISIIRL